MGTKCFDDYDHFDDDSEDDSILLDKCIASAMNRRKWYSWRMPNASPTFHISPHHQRDKLIEVKWWNGERCRRTNAYLLTIWRSKCHEIRNGIAMTTTMAVAVTVATRVRAKQNNDAGTRQPVCLSSEHSINITPKALFFYAIPSSSIALNAFRINF